MSETRKLAAILVADIVGYSRLAGADEDRILARLRTLRSDLIDPTIAVHHGRIVKRTGDGSIVEFRSVVDAVNCAVELQRSMIERNAEVAADKRIEFRVGIHVGDVIEEADGDLMGDGVNIAARLEGICEPGGIVLSSAAHEHARDRVKEPFVDLGERALKNIARSVHAYSVAWDRMAARSRETPLRLSLPDKPSIAVLPFQNMSGDPEQDYFADGMVEDIVTGLSRIKWLFVIARNSSFVYKGKAIDVRQAGRELGVRYILEGGVRKAGQRLRVTAQLVEAETGAHLWADKFDGELKDVFELQDQITERVVAVVEPNVRKSEIERSRRKRPENLDAYDLYLRALPYLTPLSAATAPMAAEFLTKSLTLDPNFAAARAHLAWCHQIRFNGGFDEADRSAGLQHARAAIASDVDDATALAVSALVIGLLAHDRVAALNAIERAVSVNPSAAAAYFHGAFLYGLWGHSLSATSYAQRALRLSPFDPFAFHAHHALTMAAILDGRYDEAAAHGAKLAQISPSFPDHVMTYAAALALAGHIEEARQACARALQIDPSWSIRTGLNAGSAPELDKKWVPALRLLGVPE